MTRSVKPCFSAHYHVNYWVLVRHRVNCEWVNRGVIANTASVYSGGCICSIDSCLITDCYNVSCANHKLFVDFHWELLYFQTLYNMLWEGEGRDLPSFIHSIRTSDITDNMLHDCNMNLFLFVCVCVFSCMCLCVCAFVSLGLCPYSATCNHPDYGKTHQCRHTNVHARTHTLQ